jgi:hypothetical protein
VWADTDILMGEHVFFPFVCFMEKHIETLPLFNNDEKAVDT